MGLELLARPLLLHPGCHFKINIGSLHISCAPSDFFSKFSLTSASAMRKMPPSYFGGIAKWPKATVCKTVIRGFKSHSRLSVKEPAL